MDMLIGFRRRSSVYVPKIFTERSTSTSRSRANWASA